MKPYREILGHPEDFVVKYKLYSPAEGGRKVTFQHLRCDFLYEKDDPERDSLFMIYPEFLDENGQPLDDDFPVPLSGSATMWISVPEMRKAVHQSRIAKGVRGYFMEGARKIGEVEVVKVVGLHTNDN